MIRIIVDSTCEFAPELLGHPAIVIVPLSVVFGQTALRDGIDITREQFWERLPQSNPLPTTSQANPGDFLGLLEKLTDAGDEVIILALSSKLSGTYASAVIARDSLPGRPIDVIDSHTISVGSGLMTQKALEMALAGVPRREISARLGRMREEMNLMFALDTLEYLQRGGRIGRAQALVGTLLKFKPLLGLQEGEVYPVCRVRTHSRALESLIELLSQKVPQRGPGVRLGVAQAGVPEEAAQVAQLMSQRFETPHVYISALGPVIGTHTGPGAIGAAVWYDAD
jgi:DegV family protein with EDD domain